VPDSRLIVLVLVAGVVVPGVADYALTQAGRPALGAAVWVGGYGAAVLAVWVGWLRHLDLGRAESPR
jgi:hypothetical protein